uniref:Uncharacterized protein n=1 Tax=Peronospora matthiolae TaxID=2874970 RepID=A0AAV1TB78_9STRA
MMPLLKGTKVEYGQLLRLLMLAQNEALNERSTKSAPPAPAFTAQ